MMIKQPTNSARSFSYSAALLVSLLLAFAASVPAKDLSQELARARAATAKYHSLAAAEADGYVQDVCHVDGCHWFKWDLYDGTFEIERPEALNYVPTKNGGWRLVAVEYVVLGSDPPQPAPEGFTGDEDAPDGDEYGWRFNTEGFLDWELSVWLWSHNPNGMFAMENPRFEEE